MTRVIMASEITLRIDRGEDQVAQGVDEGPALTGDEASTRRRPVTAGGGEGPP